MEHELTYGAHASPEDGLCLLELVALLAGEEHSDIPVCVCPVLSAYGRKLSDAMGCDNAGDELRAKHLTGIAQLLLNTVGSRELRLQRAYLLADRAVRVIAPMALVRYPQHAELLRDLPPVTGVESAVFAAAQSRAVAGYLVGIGKAGNAVVSASYAASRAAKASDAQVAFEIQLARQVGFMVGSTVDSVGLIGLAEPDKLWRVAVQALLDAALLTESPENKERS